MKIPQLSNLVTGQVVADSTDPATIAETEWMLAAGGTKAAITLEIRQPGGTGTFKAKMRYRFAAVRPDDPGAWNTSSTERSGAGEYVEENDISGTTTQMWVQGAVAGYQSGGVAEALTRLQASIQGNGVLIAQQTIDVEPIANSGTPVRVALARPFPQTGLTGLMYAVAFSGVNGTITWRPLYREIKGNPANATYFSTIGSASTTNTDTNTGIISITPTSGYFLGQAGIQYIGDAYGTMKVTVAAIY